MPTNQRPVPPPNFSGFMWNPFGASLQYIYDSTVGPSGAYRALTSADMGSGNNTIGNSGFFANSVRIASTSLTGNSGVAGATSPLYTNTENGVLFVQQANLDKTQDTVRAYPLQNATIATGGRMGVQSGPSGATIFTANTNRNMLYIQNLNTGALYLSLSGAASSVNFNIILSAATALDDGKGGTWATDTWLGSVNVSGTNGYRVTAFEY